MYQHFELEDLELMGIILELVRLLVDTLFSCGDSFLNKLDFDGSVSPMEIIVIMLLKIQDLS